MESPFVPLCDRKEACVAFIKLQHVLKYCRHEGDSIGVNNPSYRQQVHYKTSFLWLTSQTQPSLAADIYNET